MGRNKFNAVRTVVDNISFASKREAARYCELKLLEKAGEISSLQCHPCYPIIINGTKVTTYIADFKYVQGKLVIVEDVKSPPTKTAVYRLKKKCVAAQYGIEIKEV